MTLWPYNYIWNFCLNRLSNTYGSPTKATWYYVWFGKTAVRLSTVTIILVLVITNTELNDWFHIRLMTHQIFVIWNELVHKVYYHFNEERFVISKLTNNSRDFYWCEYQIKILILLWWSIHICIQFKVCNSIVNSSCFMYRQLCLYRREWFGVFGRYNERPVYDSAVIRGEINIQSFGAAKLDRYRAKPV